MVQNNPVIVELFTSQGCSSCPAADKNLTAILEQAKKNGQPVYGLSFHVDYWNYIGWKDPYSEKKYSVRQRGYAEKLRLNSIYTPQMIVNSTQEFVGSNVELSKKTITSALDRKMSYTIIIQSLRIADGNLIVSYNLNKDPSGESIHAALVESEKTNFVSKGENRGRNLSHNNVVRSFVTQDARRNHDIQISLAAMELERLTLVLYMQDQKWQVVGAASRAIRERP
jgi:hypothetical protein